MHGHGSARAERVRSDVFWGEPQSGCANPSGLGQEDRDDVQGSDRAEKLVGRVVADRGGPQAPMFAHAEEYVDTHLNRAGCCQLISEVRYGFPSDLILLFVQSEDNVGCFLEVFNWGICWEELTPNG